MAPSAVVPEPEPQALPPEALPPKEVSQTVHPHELSKYTLPSEDTTLIQTRGLAALISATMGDVPLRDPSSP
jgi:hypothetical protein